MRLYTFFKGIFLAVRGLVAIYRTHIVVVEQGECDPFGPVEIVAAKVNGVWVLIEKPFVECLHAPLKELFPDPGKGGLQTIWKHGSADLVVEKDGRTVAILEPGGAHHFNDPKQIRRDKRKWKLCQLNGARCFRFANSLFYAISNRKKRTILGKVIFGLKN